MMHSDNILASSSMPSQSNLTNDGTSAIFDNNTVCADQLVGELLEGLSGRLMWGIIQLILMFLGNIGNILTLIVLNRRLMRKGGINNLLQGLAISDIVAPTLACIPHIMYYYGPKNHNKLINFVNAFFMPVATGATFCSNWIVVTITCFRLMIVVKPLYSQVYCSSRNERKALITIFLVSVLSIIPYYYYHFDTDALNVVKAVSALLSLLCPWVICVFLWILLIRIVNREIGAKKSQEFILHSEIIAQRLKSKSKITKMVLIICFFNIICQLPVLILTIFGLIDVNPCGQIRALIYVCLLFVSNLLLIVNHSINFFIYSLTNCKFRYTLQVMCRHCCVFHDPVHSRITTQRQIMAFDDQRKLAVQKSTKTKYDCNSCSNSKSRESPHLMVTMPTANMSRCNKKNNPSARVAL
ncbi:unnamed protein product [Rotaria socialis]|uniref:G-protein coupled receptors family 1 profile domain-containing protein n=1 Tax=Rotaria socialis TaxID=392032 RepID=A0A821SDS5_9BILA|nr:unnamed protein product [Rotaria socialis]CAF3333019.1 unnamed protein product [Rotaria socialis]CAF3402641.1 unnamed protein product [Rotaria socialis]CAF3453591.1 unnamed protein product [Rotaria socialis]CAF3763309.1 unnamed protein product [Rotaria socialis]